MNILHVVESLDRGGLERVVVNLAMLQKLDGHEVSVCCLFRKGALASELEAREIPVLVAGKRPGPDFLALAKLRRIVRQSGAAVVHTHNATCNYYAALAVLPGRQIKLLNTRHGMGAKNVRSLQERLYRLSLTRTSVATAVCDQAAKHFVEQGVIPGSIIEVVKNGIELSNFIQPDPESRARVRSRLGIEDGAFVLGTVGRLNWAKDQELLIRSFGLMKKNESARLIIVGGGELRQLLEETIRETGLETSVLLLGDRNDVPEILTAIDVFVLTSATEGYSIALLEAAASGLPVIASDVGGNAEIVQNEATGILVSPREAQGFATAMQRLFDNTESRIRMAKSAREWAIENAGLSRMAGAYYDLYGSALNLATG